MIKIQQKIIGNHNNFKMTPESIAKSLENIHQDGSSWLINNWQKEWRDIKFDLIQSIKYNTSWHKISSNTQAIADLKQWAEEVPTWETIISTNDVAMFPVCLKPLKVFYLVHMDKEYCESVNRLSYQAVVKQSELYHRVLQRYKAEYGVFRLCSVIGHNMYKQLRRHLNITDDEFIDTYGERLLADPCCCDELLIEMLVNGRLTGVIRNYKIETELF